MERAQDFGLSELALQQAKDTGKLIETRDAKDSFFASAGKCIVRGLSAHRGDRVHCVCPGIFAYNGVAWGPTSPKIAICTLGYDGGAIITGVRAREERDADLLKHAIDVDDLDQTYPDDQTGGAGGRIVSRLPKAKRAKRET